MKRSHPIGLCLGLGALALGGWSSGVLAADALPSPAAVVKCSADCIVHTKDFAYKPLVMEVPAGTKVTFVNDDDAAHTITAVDQTNQQPIFNSGDMPKGAKWSYTFAKVGTFKYTCAYHGFMKGTIEVVKPAPAPT